MTDLESEKPLPQDAEASTPSPEEESSEAAEPEPLTPQRVLEWNAYYDLYVVLGVLLLVFLGSANRVTFSTVWNQLQVGRSISANGAPFTTDPFAYTAKEGERWINSSWLTDVLTYQVFHAANSAAPRPDPQAPPEPGVTPEKLKADAEAFADKVGIMGVTAVNALVRFLLALFLLGLRYRGPGLWWTALLVTLALGALPGGGNYAILGGLSRPALIGSETWGQMLLGLELLLIHQAINLGKVNRLYALIPLFAAWANMDDSFFTGLIVLAISCLSLLLDKPAKGVARPELKTALIVLAASAAAALLNPNHVFVYLPPVLNIKGLIVNSSRLRFSPIGATAATGEKILFVLFLGSGVLSFLLNRARFSIGRFILFALASAAWAFSVFYQTDFSIIWVYVLSLNGQEWYHRTIGTEGRMGTGWRVYSTGGRAVMIVLVFAAISLHVTGWGSTTNDLKFGFGYRPEDFPFEVADYLKDAPIKGRVFNTTLSQGDALLWRTDGKIQTYIDSRLNAFDGETFKEFNDLQVDVRDEKTDRWKPILDKYNITVLLLNADNSPKTFNRLRNSDNWIPFYDDGNTTMFGRADAKGEDLAYFKANELDAARLAYIKPTPAPASVVPPQPTTEVDTYFRHRITNMPDSHVFAARHWLSPPDASVTSYIPDIDHCIVAVREIRKALERNADDVAAYSTLVRSYQLLLAQESAILAGIPIEPANATRITQVTPNYQLLPGRTRQVIAATNYLHMTAAPASVSPEARTAKSQAALELGELYLNLGIYDLALERLNEFVDLADTSALPPERFTQLNQQISQLTTRVEQVRTNLANLSSTQQASPTQKADYAISMGAHGMAIAELEEAESLSANAAGIKSMLFDLYCQTGQPEKAMERLGNTDDPALADGPGTAAYRQGKVYFLLGNYANAAQLWSFNALPAVRYDRSVRAPQSLISTLHGEPMGGVRSLLELPQKSANQAGWEFELGMCLLEGGIEPKVAAEHLQNVLKLEPASPLRPLVTFYLNKLQAPVPNEKGELPPETKPAAEAPKPAAEAPKPAAKP